MKNPIRLALALLLLPLFELQAASYIVPADADLIRRADAIVEGEVTSTRSFRDDAGEIVTETTIQPFTTFKGGFGADPIHVVDMGGIVGAEAVGISGWTGYEPGERVLVFLERATRGYRTYGLALGKFSHATTRAGVEVFVRGNEVFGWDGAGHPHREVARRAGAFRDFIQLIAARSQRPGPYHRDGFDVRVPAGVEAQSPLVVGSASLTAESSDLRLSTDAHYPPSAYTHGTFRWDAFDRSQTVTFYASGRHPGYDDLGAAQRGLGAWTNEPNSNVSYAYGGTAVAAFVQDGINAVLFNSATDVPSGAIAFARWYALNQHTYKGETFWTIIEGDVVTKAGIAVSQKVFDEAVTHELGHTLGFRHSDQGTPASSAAVMNSVLTGNYGATLGPWDVEAATHVYTATATACTAPSITSQPASTTISSGQSVTLSVTASGSGPLSYQWYTGSSGDTSNPIAGATTSSVTVAPPQTTTYWVRVTNACGGVSSTTATVTVAVSSAPRVRNDFDGDGRSDLLWRHLTAGSNSIWLMNGTAVSNAAATLALDASWTVRGAADFNGDARADILWRHQSTGQTAMWFMNGHTVQASAFLPAASSDWRIEGVGDFNADGRADILWRNSGTNETVVWLMNGSTILSSATIAVPASFWSIQGVGDFDADGRADILWRNSNTSEAVIWLMNGAAIRSASYIASPASIWTVVGVADFNGDGTADIAWRNTSAQTVIWFMNGLTLQSTAYTNATASLEWEAQSVGDYNADGRADFMWRNTVTGENAIWLMNGATVTSGAYITPATDLNWRVVS